MIVANKPVVCCGNEFLTRISAATVTVISGKPMPWFPAETHRCVGKAEGETNHIERWNNRLRQSNARYVRKTLSFSKSDVYHEIVTRYFIVRHNLTLAFET